MGLSVEVRFSPKIDAAITTTPIVLNAIFAELGKQTVALQSIAVSLDTLVTALTPTAEPLTFVIGPVREQSTPPA